MTDSVTATNGHAQAPTSGGIAARLARPNILDLQPYRCARDDYSDGILLDANENAFGPPFPKSMARRGGGEFNGDTPVEAIMALERYPDPYQVALKEKVAAYRNQYSIKTAGSHDHAGLSPANIFVGVGSDEAIDMLIRIFCRPGHDDICITPPTYGMYKVCAKTNDVSIVSVPLTPNFDVVIPDILTTLQQNPTIKILFLCSPGNPTCKTIPVQDVEQIAKSPEAQNCLLVIDEAYIDFCSNQQTQSALSLVVQGLPNVVVLQTMSKAFGLAAIRCGYCIGPPDVIDLMNKVKAPYNVNALSSRTALEAFDHIDILHNNITAVLEQRGVIVQALSEMDFVTMVYPSDANFVLFRVKQKALQLYQTMAESVGVVTRYRGTELHCNECIRVTVGTADQNQAFLEALAKTYKALTTDA